MTVKGMMKPKKQMKKTQAMCTCLSCPDPFHFTPQLIQIKRIYNASQQSLLPDFETVEVERSPAQQRRAADHEGVGPDEDEGTEG